MDNDTSAADDGRRIIVITVSELIVINHGIRDFVPNLDAELILTSAAVDLSVNCRQHKPVFAAAVNRSRAFALRFCTADNQPIIACAFEIEISHTKLKLGISS